ncbi:MAG TPA: condensation domain-containing protein, partial [Rugosimonospora sp.]|nr:condensation domain-containing protein [Rugosimonospora sp.]
LAAVRDLARRHPLLRVRAVDTPGGPRLVDAGDDMQAQLVDLTAHTPDEAAQIARGIRQGVGRPADPYAVTAGRAVLLAESDGAHRLLLSMSHVLFDGWSVDALRAELIDLLYRGGAGAPAPDGAALDAYLDAMDDWVSWRGADAAVLAHARAFHDAERAAQSRVGHLVRPGRVAVAGATIPKAAGGTEAGMVAAMALAARRVFGLEQVPIARAQHGRRLGTRSFFDVVGNTADLVPLVLPPGEPAATVEAAARALVAGQIDQFHWLAYLRRYDPVLLRDWPRPAHPLAATLRLGYTQNNPVADESVTLLDGETQSAPSRDGSLEVQVGAGGSGLACAVTGWGLPERTVSHYAVALAGALAELAEDGGRP